VPVDGEVSSVKKNYLTPEKLSEKYPEAFPVRWIRNKLAEREKNGLSVAVHKVGGTILIDEEKFFAWIESHGAR
jgi:hypothetical protein